MGNGHRQCSGLLALAIMALAGVLTAMGQRFRQAEVSPATSPSARAGWSPAGGGAGGEVPALQAFTNFLSSPPVIRSLKARIELRGISFMFTGNDITNLPSLAGKLRDPAGSDAVSQYLRTNLSRATGRILSNYDGAMSQQEQLRQALVGDLNRIIFTRPLYDTQRFAGVRLSGETLDLLRRRALGSDLLRLNRLLLLDAYPGEMSNKDHPGVREVFLELRWQTNAFYVKTATSLDALAEAWVRPIGLGERAAGAQANGSLAAGWYGSNLWCIANGVFQTDSLSQDLCKAYAVSNRNPVILQMPLLLASRVMNLGIPSEKLGALRWFGNTTTGADHFGEPFTADVQADGQGQPSGLKVVYPRHPARAGTNESREVSLAYEYGREIPGWKLPTRIRIDGSNCVVEILSAELSQKPQGRSRFDYRPFVNRRSGLMLVVARHNERDAYRARYDDLKHGLRGVAGIWLTKRELRSWIYLGFCALTASIVTVGVAIEKRRTRTKQLAQLT